MMSVLLCAAFSFAGVTDSHRAERMIEDHRNYSDNYYLRFKIEWERVGDLEFTRRLGGPVIVNLWRQGSKLRVDYHKADQDISADQAGVERKIACQNCVVDDHCIVTNIIPKQPSRFAVEFRPPKHPMPVDSLSTFFDWRFFGFAPWSLSNYCKFSAAQYYKGHFTSMNATARIENWREAKCDVITVKHEEYERSIWISENHAWHPVRIIEDIRHPQAGNFVNETDVMWSKNRFNHWFPTQVVERSTTISNKDGQKATTKTTYTIYHSDFSSPIDSKVFTLEGFGLREGQPILYPDSKPGKEPTWRNGRVDVNYTAEQRFAEQIQNDLPTDDVVIVGKDSPTHGYKKPRSGLFWFAVSAGGFSVIAAIAALVRHRRRAT